VNAPPPPFFLWFFFFGRGFLRVSLFSPDSSSVLKTTQRRPLCFPFSLSGFQAGSQMRRSLALFFSPPSLLRSGPEERIDSFQPKPRRIFSPPFFAKCGSGGTGGVSPPHPLLLPPKDKRRRPSLFDQRALFRFLSSRNEERRRIISTVLFLFLPT